jgi:SAM-dependent methyltransferase/uncharacterized protein YbaR (Trm112 family)
LRRGPAANGRLHEGRMKIRLLKILACPWCGGPFEASSYDEPAGADDPGVDVEITEGLLRSSCGRVFPIVRGIPRIFDDALDQFPGFVRAHHADVPQRPSGEPGKPRIDEAIDRTRDSFGYQWTVFHEMAVDFRDNFLFYISPLQETFFKGKIGLDLGCGFGRHVYNSARFGAEMVGVDLSEAIESTRQNTRDLPNVHLIQADVYHLPFQPGVFDFAYSIGVLHHLPDPERGFRCLIPIVKPGGALFIWVYSKSRAIANFLLESVRAVTTRLPKRLQKALSWTAAVIDWGVFVVPYRNASRIPGIRNLVSRLPLPRLRVYAQYPFQVVYADWFDRLAAPIRFYYDDRDLTGWLSRASLTHTLISPTGLFGWRAYGERP